MPDCFSLPPISNLLAASSLTIVEVVLSALVLFILRKPPPKRVFDHCHSIKLSQLLQCILSDWYSLKINFMQDLNTDPKLASEDNYVDVITNAVSVGLIEAIRTFCLDKSHILPLSV